MNLTGEGYEYVTEDGSTQEQPVYIHRLVAVAEYGIDAVKDMDVHHKVPIQWLNVPDNLEPVDPIEHRTSHL